MKLVPFTEVHLRDPRYMSWLRDRDVLLTLNLPRYLAGDVTEIEIAKYCHSLIASPDVYFYALIKLDGGRFIGTVKAGPVNRYAGTCDLGIMIGEKAEWGRGLATDALDCLSRHLVDEVGIRRLTAGAMASNPAMVKTFEKLGFRVEGVFREQDRVEDEFVDHIHLGCLKHELKPRFGEENKAGDPL